MTSLHLAIHYDQPEVACYLLRIGASAEAKDNKGDDAMHYAARNRQDEVITAIFETEWGYVEQPNREGYHPSDYAWDEETANKISRRSALSKEGTMAKQAR